MMGSANRTLLSIWTMLLLSIVAIGALAILWTRQLDRSARQRQSEVLADQLAPYNRDIARTLAQYELEFEREIPSVDLETQAGVAELKRNPLVQTLVIVNAEKQLIQPKLEMLTLVERSLVLDALAVVNDHTVARADAQTVFKPQQGWTAWYHQRGLVLGYLWQQDNGSKAMIVLPRARWIADLIAALPDQNSGNLDARAGKALKQLIDVEGNVVYQWGVQLAGTLSQPDAEVPVADPLDGWRLRLFADEQTRRELSAVPNRLATLLGVAGLSAALLLLGLFATVNLRRELRLASQRVSFVNQVSHELRTPLTNIRMYADLLADQLQAAGDERDLDQTDAASPLSRLDVIRSESERLTRLIGNVLTMAREGKEQPALHLSKTNVDEVVDTVLATFDPQLASKQMVVDRQRGSNTEILVDRDAFEQILVNLLSNAEKYATSGEYLRVATCQQNGMVEIRIQDRGPGIAAKLRERVFEPFVRGSDRLEDPAGTGIGLSIARQLARRLGGDCILEPSPSGACFCVRIPQRVPQD